MFGCVGPPMTVLWQAHLGPGCEHTRESVQKCAAGDLVFGKGKVRLVTELYLLSSLLEPPCKSKFQTVWVPYSPYGIVSHCAVLLLGSELSRVCVYVYNEEDRFLTCYSYHTMVLRRVIMLISGILHFRDKPNNFPTSVLFFSYLIV